MFLNPEEVNKLVLQYLKESGYHYSLYTFQNEAKTPENAVHQVLPDHSLMNLLLKGLAYDRLEKHIHENGTATNCTAPYELNRPHKCNTDDKIRLAYYVERDDSQIQQKIILDEKAEGIILKIAWIKFHPGTISVFKTFELQNAFKSSVLLGNNTIDITESEEQTPTYKKIITHYLATGDLNGKIRAWDLLELKSYFITEKLHDKIKDNPSSITLSNLNDKICIPFTNSKKTHLSGRYCCGAWDKTGKKFAIGKSNGLVDIYVLNETGQKRFEYNCSLAVDEISVSVVSNMIWGELKDNNNILVAHLNGSLRMWDLRNQKVLKTYNVHTSSILSMSGQKDSGTFITTDSDGFIRYFGALSPTPLRTFAGHKGDVNGCIVFNNKTNVLSWGDDGTIRLWGFDTNKVNEIKQKIGPNKRVKKAYNETDSQYLIKTFTDHIAEVNFVEMLEDNTGFISASADFTVKIWDLKKELSTKTLHCKNGHPITTLRYLSIHKIIAVGSYNGLFLYDYETGKLKKTIKFKGSVTDLCEVDELLIGNTRNDLFIVDLKF